MVSRQTGGDGVRDGCLFWPYCSPEEPKELHCTISQSHALSAWLRGLELDEWDGSLSPDPISNLIKSLGTSLAVQWLQFPLPKQGLQVQSLVGELRSHMPRGQKAKTLNRSNAVTNSIKTLKMVRMRKKKKKTPPFKCFILEAPLAVVDCDGMATIDQEIPVFMYNISFSQWHFENHSLYQKVLCALQESSLYVYLFDKTGISRLEIESVRWRLNTGHTSGEKSTPFHIHTHSLANRIKHTYQHYSFISCSVPGNL